MSEQTNIEWADSTFNPWIGCTKVGPGCDHCYASTMDARKVFKGVTHWGPGVERMRTSDSNWNLPLKWNDEHDAFFAKHGRRRRVFCASLADVFDNEVIPSWRADLMMLIDTTPNLDWLLVTKRIGNAKVMLQDASDLLEPVHRRLTFPLPNLWLGATVVNQAEADRDIPKLLKTPAAIRFLSMEPLLGAVDLTHINKDNEENELNCLTPWTWEQEAENWRGTSETWMEDLLDWYDLAELPSGQMHNGLDWVIAGGESGVSARPMNPNWVNSLRDQCKSANVPFLFKQWGEWAPTRAVAGGDLGGDMRRGNVVIVKLHGENDGHVRDGDALMRMVGKHVAGRLISGFTHDGYPETAA